jgi:hypothetical protein
MTQSNSTRIMVYMIDPTPMVDWFTEHGYRQAWCSQGWTYEGLDKVWRIERGSLISKGRRWKVMIKDEKLAMMFALRFQ